MVYFIAPVSSSTILQKRIAFSFFFVFFVVLVWFVFFFFFFFFCCSGTESSFQIPFFHIQLAAESAHFAFSQVKLFVTQRDIDPYPISCIDYFGKIFRVAFFPTAYAGFIWIIYPGNIVTGKRFAAVSLLKIGTLAHTAIAQAKNALGYS